jgi:hypothetical protein
MILIRVFFYFLPGKNTPLPLLNKSLRGLSGIVYIGSMSDSSEIKGIQYVKGPWGELKEIRLDVGLQPQLAENLQRLIAIHQRHHHLAEQPTPSRDYPSEGVEAFHHLVKEAKLSGEISENSFFQMHPEWQSKQNGSSSAS